MRTLLAVTFSLAAGLFAAHAASAEKAGSVPVVVAPSDRVVAGGRAILVTLEQTSIATSIDLGRIAPNNGGGGIIGNEIVRSMDDRAAIMTEAELEKAEVTVRPLRAALGGFDVDAIAYATAKTALATPDWIDARDIVASKARAGGGRAEFLATTSTAQIVFITYRYDLSPDFTQIRVDADVRIDRRGAIGPLYRQHLLSIVQLGTRSYEPRENVTRWSADHGALARKALSAAFARLETLIPFALERQAADIAVWTGKKQEQAFAAGYYGAVVARNSVVPGDMLLWNKQLIAVQTLP